MGKKIKGKKWHILVDTLGLLLHAIVHPADIQDRDGGVLVVATLFGMPRFCKTLFADGGYQGPQFAKPLAKVLQSGLNLRTDTKILQPLQKEHRLLSQSLLSF